MNFWDSSAIVPLIVEEPQTQLVLPLLKQDDEIWVWWSTLLECRTAIARRLREGNLTFRDRNQALDNLLELSQNWHEIQPAAMVRDVAVRLVETHLLRSADALQLAAAIVAAGASIHTDQFIAFDQHLARAAVIEGFRVPFAVE